MSETRTLQLDPGSFRDRKSRVFYFEGRIFRALGPEAQEAWKTLSGCAFFSELTAAGKIVGTREAEKDVPLDELSSHWVSALEHDPIPFVSYPYEWSFGMLRDAALLQLELLLAALDEDMILGDASSYNVQWRGHRPVFIDIGSFESWQPGSPWVGYRQFCQLFLYPLLLTAYRDLPANFWLRGAIDGITPEECARLFSLRDYLRPGVFTDVYLQAKLQARNTSSDTDLRADLRRAGFRKDLILHNVERLQSIVRRLRWRRKSSEWKDYDEQRPYDRGDDSLKEHFVRQAAASGSWSMVWDLGCNLGAFSCIAAEHAEYVVAMDSDPLTIEHLYRALRESGPDNILPLVNNLADPSPALGWRQRERKPLTDRQKPDLTLCLALVHHLVITANVPLSELLAWLAELDSHLVIEFVAKSDPMVQKLLRNKTDIYHDYEIEVFEKCLGERFEILRRERLSSGHRTLYFARPLEATRV